jgi:4-amino-4-deoxy-L-arabinose transferase-like glycosyltransferase
MAGLVSEAGSWQCFSWAPATGLIPTKDNSTKAAPSFPPVFYVHLCLALLAGLFVRLFFITHFQIYAGDTKFYEELARNWLDHGAYGVMLHGELIPVDMRVPGYPAFLAVIYAVFGRGDKTVMLVQAIVDLAACVLAALIAARLAPASKRNLAAIAALWMAALCPFIANYTAVVLTETLAIFLTTLTLLVFVCVIGQPWMDRPIRSFDRTSLLRAVGWFLLGGILVGVGTLVRPETPLLLVAVGLVLCARWRRSVDWPKLALAVLWMAVGLLLPLLPWAVRNARTMGRIEFLAPRYAQTAGDYVPVGFYDWTRTWMVRFGEAYLAPWKLQKAPILIQTLPDSAFDSPAERIRVAALLESYNGGLRMSPMADRGFEQLAHERTARHPMRTYVLIPIRRAWAIWFTPRIELLPYSGKLWPPRAQLQGNPTEFKVTLWFEIINCIYLGLAFWGAWRCRRNPAMVLLITFIIVRTVVLTQLQTVEPRYVIVCFPALLAIAAQVWAKSHQETSAARRRAMISG